MRTETDDNIRALYSKSQRYIFSDFGRNSVICRFSYKKPDRRKIREVLMRKEKSGSLGLIIEIGEKMPSRIKKGGKSLIYLSQKEECLGKANE